MKKFAISVCFSIILLLALFHGASRVAASDDTFDPNACLADCSDPYDECASGCERDTGCMALCTSTFDACSVNCTRIANQLDIV